MNTRQQQLIDSTICHGRLCRRVNHLDTAFYANLVVGILTPSLIITVLALTFMIALYFASRRAESIIAELEIQIADFSA